MDVVRRKQVHDLWKDLIGKALEDPVLQTALQKDPKGVLEERGVQLPEGCRIEVVENTEEVLYLQIPPMEEAQLTKAELKQIAAGVGMRWIDPSSKKIP